MKRFPTLFLGLALCLGGCATTKPKTEKPPNAGLLQRYAEVRRLSSAVGFIEKGDTAQAIKLLETICNGSPAPGITDEALFRLALLTMKPSAERPASPQGVQYLKRLKKEYPASPWTTQAAPLVELVNSAEELKRQNRNYRSSNQTLTREINELNKTIAERNKSIEELKHLDLEIEKKTR